MLIVYRSDTGEVVDNPGVCSAWPDGPPDELAYVNTDAAGLAREQLALLRLHDGEQAELVAAVLAGFHHVDPATGEVVIDGPNPGLTADRGAIPADGATFATVTYVTGEPDPPGTVTFAVNGAFGEVAVVDGRAELEVVAGNPGPLEVECRGLTVMLEAT